MQPQKLSKEQVIDINKKIGFDKKSEGAPEGSAASIKLHIKGTLRCFIESAKAKILEADPNLEKSMIISM